jgi:acyl carrier protein
MQLSATAFEQVRAIASDVFGVPVDRLSAGSSPESVENWDSMQHLNLVLAIEEKFGVQLDPEEIEQMKNIGAVAALVDKKLQSTAR